MNNIYLYYIFYWIYIHLVTSNIEYIIHRFIMHKPNNLYGNNHIIHHKHADKNMNLINRETDEYKKLGDGENLIIGLPDTIMLSILTLCFTYIFYIFCPKKINKYFLILLPLIYILYAIIMWNSIHPYIHKKCGRDYTIFSMPCNFTEYIAKTNSFVKWIIENHTKHHIYKGENKGNYNITIPGADFIYNTYN
uniref:Fatty acid desaturase domain-containing protein n=1 Tax=viral metagenome TaxID=1070528 RepID=A0A6C0AVF1_9ZZZZ